MMIVSSTYPMGNLSMSICYHYPSLLNHPPPTLHWLYKNEYYPACDIKLNYFHVPLIKMFV